MQFLKWKCKLLVCAQGRKSIHAYARAKQFPEHFFEEVRDALAILFGRLMRNCALGVYEAQASNRRCRGKGDAGRLIAKRAKPIHTRARGALSHARAHTHSHYLRAQSNIRVYAQQTHRHHAEGAVWAREREREGSITNSRRLYLTGIDVWRDAFIIQRGPIESILFAQSRIWSQTALGCVRSTDNAGWDAQIVCVCAMLTPTPT